MTLTDDQRRHLERRLREERERALTIVRRYDEQRSTSLSGATGEPIPFERLDLIPWARSVAVPARRREAPGPKRRH